MSLAEILQTLRTLTVEERQQIVSTAIHLDEPTLHNDLPQEDAGMEITDEEKRILDERWRNYRANPDSFITLDELKTLMADRRKR